MGTVTITGAQPAGTLVQYKEAGKHYNSANVEGGGSPDPFDQITVAPGTTWTLPEGGTLIAQRDLGGAPQQGGTPEDQVITGNEPNPTPSGNAPQQGGTPD